MSDTLKLHIHAKQNVLSSMMGGCVSSREFDVETDGRRFRLRRVIATGSVLISLYTFINFSTSFKRIQPDLPGGGCGDGQQICCQESRLPRGLGGVKGQAGD